VAARLLKPVKQSLLLDNILRIMSPVATERSAAPALPAVPVETASATASLRVLLAEDNPVNVKFALKVLQLAGHTVTVVNNGKQAVDQWRSDPVDLVLMDLQMPEMDGLEATRAIRAAEKERNTHTPIIAMTANAMAGDREICFEAGMDGYVAKPVKKDLLLAEIQRVMTTIGGGRAARV
jgi:CheY-like chemotaxis protein